MSPESTSATATSAPSAPSASAAPAAPSAPLVVLPAPAARPPGPSNTLQPHFDRLVVMFQSDLRAMARARWWWKSVGAILAVVAVTAPILVASGLIASEDLKKIALLAATLSSALYALFSPSHLALARRLDVADGLSALRRLLLDWDLAADDDARLKLLQKAGGDFDRRFRRRAFTLFEGMQKQEPGRTEPPAEAPESAEPAR